MNTATVKVGLLAVPVTNSQVMEREEIEIDPEMDTNQLLCPTPMAALGSIICPFVWLGGCEVVNPNEALVLLVCGEYRGTISKQGCYCMNKCFQEARKVSLKMNMTQIKACKSNDKNGTPIIVDGAVSWKVVNPRKAILDVNGYQTYVTEQAGGALRLSVAQFPFESEHPGEHSLRSNPHELEAMIVDNLQQRVNAAGIKITGFAVSDLSYSVEIAQTMLVKQQAEATVKARNIIVNGAVNIAADSVTQLRMKGIELSKEKQDDLVRNVITVLCSDRGAQPVVRL